MTWEPRRAWTAQWIEPHEPQVRDVHRPVYHLAGTLELGALPRSARLHATAHGIYEAFVNGVRVGDAELTPGFTSYRTRLRVQTFEVADLLREGENVVGFMLSDGWWRGQNGGARWVNSWGTTTGVLAELEVDDDRGENGENGDSGHSGPRVALATDEHWKSTPSHILAADPIAGEVHDLRRAVVGWSEPGTDRSSWDRVRVADHPYETLCPPVRPPVRRIEELSAVSVREVSPGRHIVDFGQNSNGWVRLTDLGPAGTELTIVHGEALDNAGTDVQLDAISAVSLSDDMPDPSRQVPFQTDVVISAGSGAVFEPRHSTKGFRYVRVDGHPGPLDPSSITSVVVHSDLRALGAFACSDERLNRLHDAATWSLRGNMCDIPTDCPTRERSAWTGDWQVFVEAAAYLYDVTDFSLEWLLDVAAEQLSNGTVTNFVPDPTDFVDAAPDAMWPKLQGSAGWGDATVHVPWALHRATGRTDVIEAVLPAMRAWVDYAAGRAAGDRHPTRKEARPTAAPHERFIWDTGFHFGEWNEPDRPPNLASLLAADQGITATAFLYRSASELADVLEAVGRPDDAAHYRHLALEVRRAWVVEFVDAEEMVRPATQANLVRALAFDLVPAELRASIAQQLVELIAAADGHLATGFLATPYLLPVLADRGHLDVAYDVLLQTTPPSWLHMIDQGATTIWESWSALGRDGVQRASLNHYSMGAVIGFLHRYVGGIRILDPGYKRVGIAPRPGGGVTSARTYHDGPNGRIEVAWWLTDGRGAVEVVVPPHTIASIALPDGSEEDVGPGEHRREWPLA